MTLSRLKIPTKELPLIALGIIAVLVSSILRLPLIQYIIIAVFFGILSKETRWKFWSMFLLIEGFSSLRFLLRTDRYVLMADTLMRTASNISNSSLGNTTIIDNSSIAMIETFFGSVGNNPIFSNPTVAIFLSIISVCLTIVLGAISVVASVVYILLSAPIFGYTVLMLYVFHRDVLMLAIDIFLYDTDPSGLLPGVVRVVTLYMLQGIVIQTLLMTATLPLIIYKILKRIGFYKRIPGIHS